MIEVKGKKVNPKYTIGALEKFHELTGVDLLFEGGDINTPLNRKALVFVGLADVFKEISEINEMSPAEFIKVFGYCMESFTKSLGVNPDDVPEEAEVEKN